MTSQFSLLKSEMQASHLRQVAKLNSVLHSARVPVASKGGLAMGPSTATAKGGVRVDSTGALRGHPLLTSRQ